MPNPTKYTGCTSFVDTVGCFLAASFCTYTSYEVAPALLLRLTKGFIKSCNYRVATGKPKTHRDLVLSKVVVENPKAPKAKRCSSIKLTTLARVSMPLCSWAGLLSGCLLCTAAFMHCRNNATNRQSALHLPCLPMAPLTPAHGFAHTVMHLHVPCLPASPITPAHGFAHAVMHLHVPCLPASPITPAHGFAHAVMHLHVPCLPASPITPAHGFAHAVMHLHVNGSLHRTHSHAPACLEL
jgi:hypothetical protein